MKKLLVLLLAAVLLICAAGCGAKTKTVNCDGCGAEVEVDEKSAMNDEEWIIYCEDCEKANGLDNFFEE
jgi:hypothetical protein